MERERGREKEWERKSILYEALFAVDLESLLYTTTTVSESSEKQIITSLNWEFIQQSYKVSTLWEEKKARLKVFSPESNKEMIFRRQVFRRVSSSVVYIMNNYQWLCLWNCQIWRSTKWHMYRWIRIWGISVKVSKQLKLWKQSFSNTTKSAWTYIYAKWSFSVNKSFSWCFNYVEYIWRTNWSHHLPTPHPPQYTTKDHQIVMQFPHEKLE